MSPYSAEQYVTMSAAQGNAMGAVNDILAALVASVGGKASSASVDALVAAVAAKASSASVDTLATSLLGKASISSVDALGQALADKVGSAALAAAIAGKASAQSLADLATLAGGKASGADLTAALARVAAVELAQGALASAAALTAAVTRITSLEGALATVPQFISATTMTVENLLANNPAASAYRGKYVRVSNFGGYVDRVLRCDFDANLNYYFWTPTQGEYGRSMALPNTGGGMTLKRLLSPQSVVLTGGGLIGGQSVTIDVANGRPGEMVEIKKDAVSLLSGLNILGTGLGSGVALLAGGYQKYVIDGSSGSLQLVRLV